jgi:uncharacterized membrane protein
MDIVKSFTDAWNIYTKNFFTIFLSSLTVLVLSFVTLGILYIPLMIGLQMLFVKAKRGDPVSLNNIFSPIKRFFALFFGSIWMNILIMLGLILLIIPGLCWASWWIFALLFIFDRGIGIGEGMRKSKDVVRKNNLWLHLLLLILAGVVSNIGLYVYGIGLIFTLPLGLGAIACAYADESK